MKKRRYGLIFCVFVCFVLLCYPLFLKKTFGPVSLDQFLFHLMNPLKGTDPRLYYKGFLYIFLLPAILTLVYCTPSLLMPKRWKKKGSAWENSCYPKRCAWLLFLMSLALQVYALRIDQWYYGHTHPTTLFRDSYVAQTPDSVSFDKKLNAVVIYMESMENTYSNFSVFSQNYTPELTTLAQDNISFDRFHQFPGTQWTMAGVFSSMCGIPLKIPLKGVRLDMFKTFVPGAVCIPQILQAHGYQTGMILGTDASFSGMDNFAAQHGFEHYWGIHEIKSELGEISPDMLGSGWGLNDNAMFNFAKEKITAAAQIDKPFFFVLETIDTHFPNGFFNARLCERSENNMTDVVRCSSKEISQFVDWLRVQPFAKNTAIILLGDHITMGNDVYDTIVQNPNRQVLNIFINGVHTDAVRTGRAFGTFDLAPTILSFMGANLPDHAFGLGRDLFSNVQTLTEIMGPDQIRVETQKYSPEYQNFFKPKAK